MKIRDLIKELLSEDLDSEVFGKYTDDEGTDRFFSMDGLAIKGFSPKVSADHGYTPDYPTIVLDDA